MASKIFSLAWTSMSRSRLLNLWPLKRNMRGKLGVIKP
jgi:hypothetical protein